MRYDAIIVGGGPAGLSAALILARSTRSVLVIDAGRPRNHASRHMHNYLTRDGLPPSRYLALARAEVIRYGVEVRRGIVSRATCEPKGFRVQMSDGSRARSRLLLLATGVVDELPGIPDLGRFYGRGVHHCPYCDAWEYRGRPLVACGEPSKAIGLAMSLLTWSANVTVVTNGVRPPRARVNRAALLGIRFRTEKILSLRSRRRRDLPTTSDPLGWITFDSGPALPVAGMFFNTDQTQRSTLPVELGCRMNADGGIIHDRRQRTGVKGLYLAGDASVDVEFVIVAAAEGAKAGMTMNRALQDEDRRIKFSKG